jgi:hypothetical protein
MAEENIRNTVSDHVNLTSENWISQINAGNVTYDIATHHSIKFYDGKGDATGIEWNGLSDLEIVIPSITDIVQTPVEFAGTVGTDGKIVWVNGHKEPAKAGNLVFITADCTFNGLACEAGDMAIYDGTKWNVVAGENQVSIVGNAGEEKTTIKIGPAKDILVVEGKTLALELDYADFNTNHLSVTPGGDQDVVFEKVSVAPTYLKLSQAEKGAEVTIGANSTIAKATGLKSGEVTLVNADSVVTDVNFGTFDAGELPTSKTNSVKQLNIAGGILSAGAGSDFVSNVTFGDVTFTPADANDANKITAITGISAKAGAEFLNGIHITKASENADITIPGGYAPTKTNVSFVEGLKSGNPVIGIKTAGSFKLDSNATEVVTGFGAEAKSGDVLSSVTVTANNNTSVLNTATVTDHVLSFGSTNVTSGVSVDANYKSLTKTGFTYTDLVLDYGEFTTSGFTQAENVKYTFDKGKETTYESTPGSWKISTPALNVTKGAYTIDHTNMKATVEAGTFISEMTAGKLPSLTGTDTTKKTITGTVGTDLTYENVNIHTLAEGVDKITLPGAYTLGVGTESDKDVTVAAAGNTITAEAYVNLSTYVKGVSVVEKK